MAEENRAGLIRAFEIGVDRMQQRAARAERAQLAQPRHEFRGVPFRRALAGPVDHRAARERLGDDWLLQQRGVLAEIVDRGVQLAPVLFVAEDIHHAAAAHVVAVVEDREIGKLQLVAVEFERRVQFVHRRAAPGELRAADDDLPVKLLVLAAHGAVDRPLARGVFELRQHQRGELREVVDLRVDVEGKFRLPPLLLRRRELEVAVEFQKVVPLMQRQLRNLHMPIEQAGAEHERIPLTRFPLKICRLEAQRRGRFRGAFRRSAEGELPFLDRAARRIRLAEERGEFPDRDLRKRAGRLERELAIVRQRLRLDANAAAERRHLHFEIQATARDLGQFHAEALNAYAGLQRHARQLGARVVEFRRAAHVAKRAIQPRLLDHDLADEHFSGLDFADRETRVLQTHVVAIALENEVRVARLDALRAGHPATVRPRQLKTMRRRNRGRVDRQLHLSREAVKSQRPKPRRRPARDQRAPRKVGLDFLDLEPSDGAIFTLVDPHRIEQPHALEHASFHLANVCVHSAAPRLKLHEISQGKAEAMRLEQRAHRDDEQEKRGAKNGEAALRWLLAKFVNRSGGGS